jgi:hypothetical protein
MARHHSDLRAPATVSVWLGDFRDDIALDHYMRGTFAADFGFEYDPEGGPEASTHAVAISITELLSGFSQWRRFVDRAVAQASLLGISEASTAVVFHATRYETALATTESAPLRFLGAIELLPKA